MLIMLFGFGIRVVAVFRVFFVALPFPCVVEIRIPFAFRALRMDLVGHFGKSYWQLVKVDLRSTSAAW